MTVTLDTNVLPVNDLLESERSRDFDFAAVSVTERETEGSTLQVQLVRLTQVPETFFLGESILGKADLGSDDSASILESILAIISNGSFPKNREMLSAGERRQLRDAMIFEAHVRNCRDIFVTCDERAFVRDGRRQVLEEQFKTRILTRTEFTDFLKTAT